MVAALLLQLADAAESRHVGGIEVQDLPEIREGSFHLSLFAVHPSGHEVSG